MKRLVIVGASGHGKVVADIAAMNGYEEILFVDDDEIIKNCTGYPVVGTSRSAPTGDLFVAIGNEKHRKRLMDDYRQQHFPVLIHPSAVIAKDVAIGEGSVIMAGTVINPGTRIGKGCIVNTSSSIDHDCIIENYCHVAVGAHLCGTVTIGEQTWIGAGAVVSNNISICDCCMIGAGAVVIKNIETQGTYVGVPAKKVWKESSGRGYF